MKKFDLNIEKVLEDWEIRHAIREVIANALDEQYLTQTKEIEIYKDELNRWHIRDFGRGIKYEHLTQNENEEKLAKPNIVIGKFGVGLKDALATFNRHDINVIIESRQGHITLEKSSKHGFEDIITLHAVISEPSDENLIGTDFILDGVYDNEIKMAKDFFLIFSNDELLEQTEYGQVLKRGTNSSMIYINGLKVAEEENYLFSYNITSINAKIKKAMNRERTNVGRTAYTDRVKSILLLCDKKEVAELLVQDLQYFETGDIHDELSWKDVSVHACKLLNSKNDVIFLTPSELINAKDMVSNAESDGYSIVTIPESVKNSIAGQKDYSNNPIRDLGGFQHEWDQSFKFKFVSEKDLTPDEKRVYQELNNILNLAGGKPRNVRKILISETMRLDPINYTEANGLWDGQQIIIKRNQLQDLESFAGTLLHELAHAISDADDISQLFELELTKLLGIISAKKIRGSS